MYGPPQATYGQLIAAGRQVEKRIEREPGIVDVDISAEDDQARLVFQTDKAKAALSGVSTQNIAQTMRMALEGMQATVLHQPGEVEPLAVELRVNRSIRSATDDPGGALRAGRPGADGPDRRAG